jgi:hypothetical protein
VSEQIDWNTELRKIVREYDGLPPEPVAVQRPRRPSRTEFRLERIQEIAAKYEFYDRLSAIVGVWARLALVALLTLLLFWWPYGRDCGFGLFAFLVSSLMAIVGGMALIVRSWRERQVWPFIGASLVIVVAWTVIALNTLPRLGYPGAGGAIAGWSCPKG